MAVNRVCKADLLASLPPEWPDDLLPGIQAQLAAGGRTIVVLDDDPTGTQTVHGIPVLTGWSVEALRAELAGQHPAFYLLTNSRSLPLAEAQALNREIARHLTTAAAQAGQTFAVVSRSDSTLRGHYPGEVEALVDSLGAEPDATLIIPFFLEGGRYTIGDVHYVAEGEWLTPAGETQFARDAVFGYRSSDLRAWVEEKTGGRVRAGDVAAVSIDDIRRGGPEAVAERLLAVPQGGVCVVNSASYRDQEVFVSGLLAAEAAGRQFVYRTAASFVRVRAGIAPRPPLTRAEMAPGETSDGAESGGGLFVIGSYVSRTTTQVTALLAQDVAAIELSVARLLDDSTHASAVKAASDEVSVALSAGQDVVIFTSRELVTGANAAASLAIGQRVSAGLIGVVRGLTVRPRYLVAKGGITSSDVATRGLGVQRALVLGQALPGVPVWRLGAETRYPGLSYIVFPGNVGGPSALVKLRDMLRG